MKAQNIKNSVKNVYLAGLGMVSLSQKEIEKLYVNLLKEGKSFEKKSKQSVNKLANKAESKYKGFRGLASKQYNKVENLFEAKVEVALSKFNIPSVDDLKDLGKRVDELIKEVKKAA